MAQPFPDRAFGYKTHAPPLHFELSLGIPPCYRVGLGYSGLGFRWLGQLIHRSLLDDCLGKWTSQLSVDYVAGLTYLDRRWGESNGSLVRVSLDEEIPDMEKVPKGRVILPIRFPPLVSAIVGC